ncbi:hypothetical protein D5S17_23460 [Pseudonocardiaceae bacterium YIM PH 21723]|nr:hypothetical protein D5S17_23460 [Pseudonocardiaceae bacterium YIM PH 21723]
MQGARDRYELRIDRLDGKRLMHDPGPLTEFFRLDNDEDFEEVCGRHFVPMACAAEQTRVRDRLREMPFLVNYVLRVHHRNRSEPVASSRSVHGWQE